MPFKSLDDFRKDIKNIMKNQLKTLKIKIMPLNPGFGRHRQVYLHE